MNRVKLNEYKKLAKKIEKLADSYRTLSDEELKNKTVFFKNRIIQGESLEALLPEAFAVIVEASHRVLGMKPYFVQIIGGIALFFGNIAEMKTGEGKTLTATMPLYLRGLKGNGNFLITFNEYLARRDAEEVGPVFSWLGLTVAIGVDDEGEEQTSELKAAIYEADIVYTTHSALGFDYLFTNLAKEKKEQHVQNFRFVLIDEVDAILLDMAQTPLIVSGASKVQSNLFELANWFVKSTIKNIDFQLSKDQKNSWFTEQGIKKAENYFGVSELLGEEWTDLYRHLVLSLRANYILLINRDYVVENDQILLLDECNGRKLSGTKLQAGLHQAIEAKEGVKITKETKALGSITYQNLFKKFDVLSGMTGTAQTNAQEFRETYQVDVVVIPTHYPNVRKDYLDEVYVTNKDKIYASLEIVKKAAQKGRAVLIETGSVQMSNLYSQLLLEQKLPHNLLNATSSAKETWIISEAGKKGAITVATSMAGRGTDIKIEDAVKQAGGLLVIGTEKMASERIDNQLRGRAGRQGEPGESIFFISLDDRMIVENAPKWVAKERKHFTQMEVNQKLSHKKYQSIIFKAQIKRKNQEMNTRKTILAYDEIISLQREKIYETRNEILSANNSKLDEMIDTSISTVIKRFVNQTSNLTDQSVNEFIYSNIDYNYWPSEGLLNKNLTIKTIENILSTVINQQKEFVLQQFSNEFQFTYFKRLVILKAVDTLWIAQSDNLHQMKAVMNSRAWGQNKPIHEFQKEARDSFLEMKDKIFLHVLRNYFLSELVVNGDGTMELDFP